MFIFIGIRVIRMQNAAAHIYRNSLTGKIIPKQFSVICVIYPCTTVATFYHPNQPASPLAHVHISSGSLANSSKFSQLGCCIEHLARY